MRQLYKLLVRNPKELLEIVEVGISGGYYDDSRIIWDERSGEPFPEEHSEQLLIDQSQAISEEEQRLAKIEAQEYLNETDWYVVRYIERQIAIPQEVKDKRQEAIALLNEV